MPVRNIPALLLHLLYPSRCGCCGARISHDALLCTDCIAELRTLRTDNAAWMRQHAANADVLWDGCAGAFAYAGAARRGILALKDGKRGFHRYAAGVLADAVREIVDPADIGCVTWVPVTKQRRRIQGYAHTELLGKALAAELHCKTRSDLLCEFGETLRQHQLPAKVREIYASLRFQHTDADLHGQTVLLVDDVLTTGSTMRTCTALLREIGAGKVYVAAAAYRLHDKPSDKKETASHDNGYTDFPRGGHR